MLDGLAFAAAHGRIDARGVTYFADDLGPLLEWVQLAAGGLLPRPDRAPWLALNGLSGLHAAIEGPRGHWVSPEGGWLGVFKTRLDGMKNEGPWNAFKIAAHKAALAGGFQSRSASQLGGAFGEIHDNVSEHSGAPDTGLAVFRVRQGHFEFAVADRGVGVLESLRSNPEYASLADHGGALQLALTDGVSRFGSASQRGTGFRQLFKGLAHHNGSLRFRTGDHALAMKGESPTLTTAVISVKPAIPGFFASVACRLHKIFGA
jgi:hypothetical protein